MGKIYDSKEDYEKAFEEEFRNKVEEVAYYQGDIERTTLDMEWTETELKEDIEAEANKILQGVNGQKGWPEKNKFRAIRDKDLTKAEFIVDEICSNYDLIEVYNRAYNLHINDKPMKFGIHYFDEVAKAEINKILNGNIFTN